MANYDGILKLLAITNCLLFVNGKLLKALEDLVVITNDSIRLSCRSDIMAEIHWFHRGEHLYAGGQFYVQDKDKHRFQMDTDDDQASRTYTLVIREARHEDAGAYRCREDEGRGDASSANLTVMNTRLLCESNMNANGYIGPNTCTGNLQQETMTFNCSVSFNGTSPRLVWRTSNNSQLINSSVCNHQPNQVSCILTLTSDPSYDGAVFTCQTSQPSGTPYSCSTKVIKVQYFALDRESKPMDKTVNEEIECSVRSSLLLHFKWLLSEDNQETVVSNIQKHVIQKSGQYWCNVSYNISNVQCSSLASVIYARQPVDHTSRILAFFLGLFMVGFFATLVVSFIYITKLKEKHGKDKEENFETLVKGNSRRSDAFAEIWEDKILEFEKRQFQSQSVTVAYKETPEKVHTIVTETSQKSQQSISGIAVLDDGLFIVHTGQKEFEVYSLKDSKFIFVKSYEVKGLLNPLDIASCSDNKLLYIVNKGKRKSTKIIKVNPSGKVEKEWETSEAICQLSVANQHVIAACNESKMLEYDCNGELIRSITVDKEANIRNLYQIIALRSGYFVLSHGKNDDEAHRVCIIGDHGKLLKAFGSMHGCSNANMNLPGHLAIDGDDSVIVADTGNQRVLLLTPQLDFKRELLKTEHGLMNPVKVCLDMKRGFLFVADNIYKAQKNKAEGQILVYSVMQPEELKI